jgi:RNA polymerase sigma factor (sigma-70 family)
MSGQEAAEQFDSLLLPYLQASDEPESQRLLTRLVCEHAEPLIRTIIEYKLRSHLKQIDRNSRNQDVEDVYSETLVRLLVLLRSLKESPGERPISNFRSYVAVLTYRSCYAHLRQKYPQRHNLKDRLRHLLSNHSEFALWESDQRGWLCGLKRWKGREVIIRSERLEQLRESPSFECVGLSTEVGQRMKNPELLAVIFNYLDSPIELDELVGLLAELKGIKDHPPNIGLDEEKSNYQDQFVDPRAGADIEMEQRVYLKRLWSEICQLPPRQRAAILLNLKDSQGRGVIALFPLTAVATIEQIAEALSISSERFAALWNELPLEDTAIAELLALTRQQVINLRKSARERLARRMLSFGEVI